MVYMNLQFVLGTFYFCLIIVLVSASVWLIGRPVFEVVYDLPSFMTYDYLWYTSAWAMPFVMIGGVLLLTATMHLVKLLGQFHAGLAKAMLVSE